MKDEMKDFLEYVAEDIIGKYGTDLSRITVVFPNKRASLFLNEHLARLAGKPLWSPAYITISDLFRQQSDLMVADPIKLVCDLHKSFCQCTGMEESLDKFYGWGQLLLTDFDDIDKNMADADRVFANLRDIHELDDVSYLTDEQRAMIRRFFSNFSLEHNSELKERFLRLWSHFADIYHDFNRRLAAQGLAYEGALYRQVAEACSACCCGTATNSTTAAGETPAPERAPAFPADCYLFVGFNLLQKVEQRLFDALKAEGKAAFYWDFDHYYMHDNKAGNYYMRDNKAGNCYMRDNEAGQYIGQYLAHFPNALDVQADDIYRNFQRPKRISYIAAPTENIQARYVSTWLREEQRYADRRRTAIVLCNEALLPVVIHCLPPEVDKVNITTGYPLSQTPVASFIQLYFNMVNGGHSPRLVRIFQRHPYAKYLEVSGERGEVRDVTNDEGHEAKNQATNDEGHQASKDWKAESGLPQLLTFLRQTARNAESQDPLFQESLFRAYTLVNRIQGLVESGDLCVDDVTLQRLVGQMVQQTTIPFHGEPAEGIQVMGVLETRNLDFDHVLLLSCNEGNLPRGVNDSSFIPHGIRKAYELTTVENKVSIYAYYFHRLLQRAKDVTILYNSATEEGQRGEMSRFMLQLLVESPHAIARHTLQSGQTATRWQPQPIAKTASVQAVMQQTTRLSPSGINRYQRCPLQFYYCYVADLREADQPEDEQELDNRIFGNIFHDAAEIIYRQLPRQITRELLGHLLKTRVEIERAVDEAFRRHLPYAVRSGLHLINREVIVHYLRQLLEIDQRLAPFTILGLEVDVFRNLPLLCQAECGVANPAHPSPLRIGGRIDRLDRLSDGRIRVIDYKTGSGNLKPLADLDAVFDPARIHDHSDYYLQALLYADIVHRRQPAAPVSPALLFIQHAAAEGYDPTLSFGKDKIVDMAVYADRFNELLEAKVSEIFSPDVPFTPTTDLRTCQSCPYAQMCRR